MEDRNQFVELEVPTLAEVIRLPDWLRPDFLVFRGQRDATWPLASTFERAAEMIEDPGQLARLEHTMVLEFQRSAHLYLKSLPGDNDRLEWLALMQHHGCPTRLVDFTRSVYVAIFFAVEGAQKTSALWAVRVGNPFEQGRDLGAEVVASTYDPTAEEQANSILASPVTAKVEPGVIAVEPRRLSERSSVQQAVALFPKEISLPFQDNLSRGFGAANFEELIATPGNIAIMKVKIPPHLHDQTIHWLATMNITARSLFPGLDGYARSLATHIIRARVGTRELNRALLEALARSPDAPPPFDVAEGRQGEI